VCALANANGGTLYLGLSADPKKPVVGVPEPEQAIAQLEKEISNRLSPPLPLTLDIHDVGGKKIIRVLVPRGDDPPYAVDDNKVYVRSETETGLAVRDEIVNLVLRGSARLVAAASRPAPAPAHNVPAPAAIQPVLEEARPSEESHEATPRTGVEVVSVEERDGGRYYTMRDLRNGNVVKNVTRKSARQLWHYAITSFDKLPDELSQAQIQWQGDLGLLRTHKQGKSIRYDLVERTHTGYRFYFGVTDDGIHGAWKGLVGQEEE
jgi:Schlafen, AlbA_2